VNHCFDPAFFMSILIFLISGLRALDSLTGCLYLLRTLLFRPNVLSITLSPFDDLFNFFLNTKKAVNNSLQLGQ
jgi:hypothetical protein